MGARDCVYHQITLASKTNIAATSVPCAGLDIRLQVEVKRHTVRNSTLLY